MSTRHCEMSCGLLPMLIGFLVMACGSAPSVPAPSDPAGTNSPTPTVPSRSSSSNEAYEAVAAVPMHSKGCDEGDAGSCFKLGLLLDEGRGAAQDRTRAAELYARACKGGHKSACIPEELKAHFATMLAGLATKNLNECTGSPPSTAIRTTVHNLHVFAEIPGEDSALNVRWDLPRLISPEFESLASAQGLLWFQRASALLSAPTTLVVEVLSENEPFQTVFQGIYANGGPGRTTGRAPYNAGSVTARQVRFDGGRATCERRATVTNSSTIQARGPWDVLEAAKNDLANLLGERFGL